MPINIIGCTQLFTGGVVLAVFVDLFIRAVRAMLGRPARPWPPHDCPIQENVPTVLSLLLLSYLALTLMAVAALFTGEFLIGLSVVSSLTVVAYLKARQFFYGAMFFLVVVIPLSFAEWFISELWGWDRAESLYIILYILPLTVGYTPALVVLLSNQNSRPVQSIFLHSAAFIALLSVANIFVHVLGAMLKHK